MNASSPSTDMERAFRDAARMGGIVLSVGYVDADGRAHPGDAARPDEMRHADGFVDRLLYALQDGGIVVDRRITNESDRPLRLKELHFTLDRIDFGAPPDGNFFYHLENPRIYGKMAIPVRVKRAADMALSGEYDVLGGNRWADPGVVSERVGASPYQPFPAILASHCDADAGVVHGTLSQRVFYHNYLLSNQPDGLRLEIFSSFKSIAYRVVQPGETLVDRWFFCACDAPGDLDRVFERYAGVLRKTLSGNRGRRRVNRDRCVWGSWNDGLYYDVSHDLLVESAGFLARSGFPVDWVQLDAGYAQACADGGGPHGLGMPYEGEAGVDRKKFPHGLDGYARAVRKAGLRPAVWIGGHSPRTAKICRERPEWLVDYSLRIPDRGVLDVSLPEVRAYMERALDYFFGRCGFEGVKLDFWSYAFEDSRDLLRNKDRSGYEWRHWFLREAACRLPEDGYMQTGCDIVMGNPFLGEFFTNYRYGIDIGAGLWENVRTNFLWGAACFATHTGDLIAPNSDSIGLFPGLSDDESVAVLSYVMITRSLVEVAGLLQRRAPDELRMKNFKRACCCVNNGQDCYLAAGYDYRKTDEPPTAFYLKTGHFTRIENHPSLPVRCVALFNLGEEPLRRGLTAAELGLPAGEYMATEIWTGETAKLDGNFGAAIPPHGARAYNINRTDGVQVVNADREVVAVEGTEILLAGDGAFSVDVMRNGCPARHTGNGACTEA